MNFRPRQDYVLVRPIERVRSDILQVVSHETHHRGVVVATGPGKRDKRGRIVPIEVCVGDVVAFGDGSKTLDACYPSIHDYAEHVTYRLIQEADVCFIEPREERSAA